MKKHLSNFDSNPLICDPALFPGKNKTNIAKSNPIFPEKGREDKALILTYLDSPMAEDFPHYLFFFDFGHLQGETGVKVGSKMLTLDPFFFHKNSNSSKISQTMFLFAGVLPVVTISAILDNIGQFRQY